MKRHRTVHEEKLHSEPSTVLEPAIGHTPQYNWLAEVERMEEVEDVDDEPIAGTRAPPTPRTSSATTGRGNQSMHAIRLLGFLWESIRYQI